MKKKTKIGLITGGFVLAFACACLAAYLDDLQSRLFQNQSQGMAAGGEAFLFIGVFAFLSVFPIGLALFFLRSEKIFWNFFSIFAVGLALTGPAAEWNMIVNKALPYDPNSWWPWINLVAMLRVFGSVVFVFGFTLFAFITALPKPRKLLLIAAGIEMALFIFIVVHFLIWNGPY